MRVRDFMKTNVVTVDINTPVMESLETMRANNIKRLPIVKNGKFVGNNLRRPQRNKPESLGFAALYPTYDCL